MTPDPHSIRYFAWLYSLPAQRALLGPLLKLEHEIGASLRPGLDHHVAHTRLQWWREELERAANGSAVHPLTRELGLALGGQSTPAAATRAALPPLSNLSGLVDTAIWDLAGATFETRKALAEYCGRWAAAMLEPLVTPGMPEPATQPSNIDVHIIGAALREIEMLTDLAQDARRGRLRIPLEELERVGVEPGTIANPPWPAALSTLLRQRHGQLRRDLARGVGRDLDRRQQLQSRGLLVWTALASVTSRRAEKALPGRSGPTRFTTLANSWLAWRAARKATIGRFSPMTDLLE